MKVIININNKKIHICDKKRYLYIMIFIDFHKNNCYITYVKLEYTKYQSYIIRLLKKNYIIIKKN